MGLYNGVNTSVEAILTTRGREYLSTEGTVNITKYALSDEEVDYTLYDETHPNGTDTFGIVLDNIIPLEASPTRQNFKSFLTSSFPDCQGPPTSLLVTIFIFTFPVRGP